MQKTLGGERLGSGKKMQVNLHGYERSTHDLSYLWRSTMAAGTLVPFMSEVALPGDTFDIDLNAVAMTHPTIGPLFGSYKVQLDVFQCPIRLYHSKLHNNALGIGMNMSSIKLPRLMLHAVAKTDPQDDPNLDNSQINPSALPSYLGIRGCGTNINANPLSYVYRNFNAVPFIAYWDIYKNYYANKMEEIGAVIHTPYEAIADVVTSIWIEPKDESADFEIPENNGTPISKSLFTGDLIEINYSGGVAPDPSRILLTSLELGTTPVTDLLGGFAMTDTGTKLKGILNFTGIWSYTVVNWRYSTADDMAYIPPKVATFPLSNIDQMREDILADHSADGYWIDDTRNAPYGWMCQRVNTGTKYVTNAMASQEGLALKTYQSDLFNNWLNTEWIDGVNGIGAVTAVDTSGGSLNLDALNLAKKVYNMLNRIAVSGGTYDDWLDAVYDHERYLRAETPMYMGGLSKEIVFQEVISNSGNAEQPLGTLAGRGVMGNKHKGGHVTIKVDEPSYIMGIVSITPRLDYSQGNKWDTGLVSLNDLHKPALDEIGFQDLIMEQMAWWTTNWDAPTTTWVQQSAGKQPAWINYMTNVNQTRGNFAIASNEMFMTLNRRYEPIRPSTMTIKDLTTYIDPTKFNHIFAETAIDAQNFWMQIAVDITARRKMSAKVIPNL